MYDKERECVYVFVCVCVKETDTVYYCSLPTYSKLIPVMGAVHCIDIHRANNIALLEKIYSN